MPSSLEAEVAALFVEAILYGFYLLTLLYCLRLLVYAHDEWIPLHRINRPLLTLTLVFWATSSLDISLSFRRCVVNIRQGQREPVRHLLWSNTLMGLLVHIQALLADGVMIYRCWIVLSKLKITLVFPGLLWLAGATCSVIRAYWQAEDTHLNVARCIIISFWTCSIAINIYASSLITYRLMCFAKFSNLQIRRIRFAMRVIVESGMLYTTTAIMVLISWLRYNHTSHLIISAINFQIVGIAFNLVIIRATSDSTEEDIDAAVAAPLTTIRYTMNDIQVTSSCVANKPQLPYADEDTGIDRGEPT